MSGIRVKNKDLFRIEVNDKGEYIEFDLSDVSLNFRCYEAIDKINKLIKEASKKEKELLSKILEEDIEDYDTQNKREYAKLQNETFNEMRKAMDYFLGDGACQKIFGDYNNYDMFDLLLEEFEKPREELDGKSYFDKMQITSNNLQERLMEKYNKNKKAVI